MFIGKGISPIGAVNTSRGGRIRIVRLEAPEQHRYRDEQQNGYQHHEEPHRPLVNQEQQQSYGVGHTALDTHKDAGNRPISTVAEAALTACSVA